MDDMDCSPKAPHIKKRLECGHEGCNLYEGCRTCGNGKAADSLESAIEEDEKLFETAIEDDEKLVKKLLDEGGGVKSSGLRSALERWLKDPEDESLNLVQQQMYEAVRDMKRNRNRITD